MTEGAECDVDGCTKPAIVDILAVDAGRRCQGCMETGLGVRAI